MNQNASSVPAGRRVKLFVETSTRPVAFPYSEIRYRADDGKIETREYNLTETSALLEFMMEFIRKFECEVIIDIHSKPKPFTKAHTEGWIDTWRIDQFASKPKEHRELWKQFDELVRERKVTLNFPETSEAELKAVFSPPPNFRPGDPIENPWRKEETFEDLMRHALGKRDNFGQ